MSSKNKTVCLFGGSGFIGKQVTQALAREGYRIKIATRIPESAYELKTYGNIGQIVPVQCNYNDEASIGNAIAGCDFVINFVGILFEKRRASFKKIHTELPERIAKVCKKKDVQKFVHISALGVNKSKSKYAKSKLAGEKVVTTAYPTVTILRPSVVFGAGDSFMNMFAKLASFLPALPLIGGGTTKFQPVYVGDVADSIVNVLAREDNEFEGEIYELGGPEVITLKKIYEILLEEINRDRMLVPVPWIVAKIQGSILSLLPGPLLTCDQVTSLQSDNVVSDVAKGLEDLGVEPTAMGVILPRYLSNFKKGGRFADKKAA